MTSSICYLLIRPTLKIICSLKNCCADLRLTHRKCICLIESLVNKNKINDYFCSTNITPLCSISKFILTLFMKFSKTSEYALRILTYMVKDSTQLYSAKKLIDELKISDKYLRRLMTSLTKAGFIESVQAE